MSSHHLHSPAVGAPLQPGLLVGSVRRIRPRLLFRGTAPRQAHAQEGPRLLWCGAAQPQAWTLETGACAVADGKLSGPRLLSTAIETPAISDLTSRSLGCQGAIGGDRRAPPDERPPGGCSHPSSAWEPVSSARAGSSCRRPHRHQPVCRRR